MLFRLYFWSYFPVNLLYWKVGFIPARTARRGVLAADAGYGFLAAADGPLHQDHGTLVAARLAIRNGSVRIVGWLAADRSRTSRNPRNTRRLSHPRFAAFLRPSAAQQEK